MPYDSKYNNTRKKYLQDNMHTVALVYKNDDYEILKAAADEAGKPVARYVKDCVDFHEKIKELLKN